MDQDWERERGTLDLGFGQIYGKYRRDDKRGEGEKIEL